MEASFRARLGLIKISGYDYGAYGFDEYSFNQFKADWPPFDGRGLKMIAGCQRKLKAENSCIKLRICAVNLHSVGKNEL